MLTSLPVELLDRTLQFDSSHHVIDLWKCGDMRLNFLLANGGVTKVELKDTSATSPSRWPRLLKHLRKLRFLSVERSEGRLDQVQNIRRELMQLPSSLEVLKVKCKDADEAFQEERHLEALLPVLFESSYSSREELRLDPEYQQACSKPRMWSLAEKFPRLRSLHVACNRLLSRPQFDICGLPDSLTSLKLVCCPEWKLRDASELPRGLLKLKLSDRLDLCGKHAMSTLPPGLTSLFGFVVNTEHNLVLTGGAESKLAWVSQLPKSLTRLEGWVPWQSPLKALYPPPSLLEFKLPHTDTDFTPEWMRERLPPNLTQLQMSATQREVSEAHLRAIPRSVTNLVLLELFVFPEDATTLPIRLTTLTLPRRMRLTFDQISLLPRSLTALSLAMTSFLLGDHSFEDLPRGLRTLEVYDGAVVAFCSQNPISSRLPQLALPPSLLELRGFSAIFALGDFESGTEAIIRQLPSGLQALNLHLVVVTPIQFDTEVLPVNPFTHYSLYKLAIGRTVPLDLFWPAGAVAALPRHLRTIQLQGNCGIRGKQYHHLPRNLVTYDTSSGAPVDLEPEDLALLPPALGRFHQTGDVAWPGTVDTPDIHLVPEWTSLLPRHLVQLHVSFPIRGSDFAHLPRTLRHMGVGMGMAYAVTPSHLRSLPPGLRSFHTDLRADSSTSPLQPSDLPPTLAYATLGASAPLWRKYLSWTHQLKSLPVQCPAPKYPNLGHIRPPPPTSNSDHHQPSLESLVESIQLNDQH
jgi:hypothetical protein